MTTSLIGSLGAITPRGIKYAWAWLVAKHIADIANAGKKAAKLVVFIALACTVHHHLCLLMGISRDLLRVKVHVDTGT